MTCNLDFDMMVGPARSVDALRPTTSQPHPWEGKPAMHDQSITTPVVYKDIPGFPGYRAGDDGSIWSCLNWGGSGSVRGQLGSTWRHVH